LTGAGQTDEKEGFVAGKSQTCRASERQSHCSERGFNGVNVHPLLNFTHGSPALSLIIVRGRDPGMSYSVTF